jgi:hypothetical protein
VWNRGVDKNMDIPEYSPIPRLNPDDVTPAYSDAPDRFAALNETMDRHADHYLMFAITFSLLKWAWILLGMDRSSTERVLGSGFRCTYEHHYRTRPGPHQRRSGPVARRRPSCRRLGSARGAAHRHRSVCSPSSNPHREGLSSAVAQWLLKEYQ